MQLDWTTFILEILNFLVLVWILQHFLYRPVLDLLAARQQKILENREAAEKTRAEADAMRLQYESRLADWQKEREISRRELEEELAQIRTREMDNIKKALAGEEEKLRARNEKLLAAREAELLRSAASQAYGEAALMLKHLASPELTQRIAGVFLEDLDVLPEHDRSVLRKAAGALKEKDTVRIVSAHALPSAILAGIEAGLNAACGKSLPAVYSEDPALIAGVRAIVGECELHANLADELKFFSRQTNHER
jgi:F-type H+-transporting ATPase subunit b